MLSLLGVIAVIVYATDQLSKAAIASSLREGESVKILGDILQWYYVRNPGAAFSLAGGMTWIFTILAAIVVVVLLWNARRIRSYLWAVMFALLIAGVFGNLTDRLFRPPGFGVGHVVDFISTPWLIPAIYNVADSAIVASMAMLIILTFLGVKLDGSRERESKSETSRTATSSSDQSALIGND